jgi:hypothetical protein
LNRWVFQVSKDPSPQPATPMIDPERTPEGVRFCSGGFGAWAAPWRWVIAGSTCCSGKQPLSASSNRAHRNQAFPAVEVRFVLAGI